MNDFDFEPDPHLLPILPFDFEPDPIWPSSHTDLSDSADPSDRSPSIASPYGSDCTDISHPPRAESKGKIVVNRTYTEFAKRAIKEPTEWNSSSYVQPWTLSRDTYIDEEAESKHARDHPMYQTILGEDELYHCPFEGEHQCNHKPTKLKCNYE